MRLWWTIAVTCAAIAAACGSILPEATVNPDAPEAGAQTPTDEGGAIASAAEAGPTDASTDALAPPCVVPGIANLQAAARRVLVGPPASGPEYPFQIATDASSVYWAAQWNAPDAGPSAAPYDGSGTARIHRVAKSGAALADTLVEGQPQTTSIAVDGDYVYWATHQAAQGAIRRVRGDCVAPCKPEDVYTGSLARVTRILVAAPTVLVLLANDTNAVYRYIVGSGAAPTSLGTTGDYPSFAVESDVVYMGNALGRAVYRVVDVSGAAGTGGWGAMPVSAQGAAFLTTDCSEVWAYGLDFGIWRASLTGGGDFQLWTDAGLHDVSDIAVDSRTLYVVSENVGGVVAFDLATGVSKRLYDGNVWTVHLDADGLYWGEHDHNTGGTLYKLSD